ncbi:MAG: superoxide dismutase [Cu-Zn] SodC [Porticoccaceae bacterium]
MKTRLLALAMFGLGCAQAAELSVQMNTVDAKGTGTALGVVTVTESSHGLVFTPKLTGLASGLHGFHVHQNPNCGPAEKDGVNVPAGAAGSHYDPAATGHHDTPWGDGHLGDLPPLFVAADGTATQPVLAPRLTKLADIQNRALVIHAGGDNHTDLPAPLGGGGARLACGVIAPAD